MAEAIRLVECLESYVGAAATPTRQAENLDAIVTMLNNDSITMEHLVLGMDKYLTSMDHVIRGRAILLLGDTLARLQLKPLTDVAVHTLVVFFSDRLEDWKAVRGALVGCLALLKRKSGVGAVSKTDAETIAQSFLQNLQVQSLGKHDREICFQLLECLLVDHPEAAAEKGEDLVYGICEAADGEKDPKCLLLVFRIVEVLGQVFSESPSPLETYAADLFDILGCYFPIHFTHPKSENIEVKRHDLSRQLMLAMSSTPFFEPYAVPLFLEKLSSSLLSAKVDSLKYLSNCVLKYGRNRMKKHADSIWSSVKETILNARLDPKLSLASELFDGMQSMENDDVREALLLLQKVVMQNDDLFSSLLINDADIGNIIDFITNNSRNISNPSESMLKLHAVGCIMYISARASTVCCSRLLKTHFLRLISATGIMERTSSLCNMKENGSHSPTHIAGALYLCVELLAACRDQVNDSTNLTLIYGDYYDTWSETLKSYSASLVEGISAALLSFHDNNTQDQDAIIYLGVKGLGILATLPKDLLSESNSFFDKILKTYMSIYVTRYNQAPLWSQTTKELASIGSYISKFLDSEGMLSFISIVIDKMVLLASIDDGSIPLHVKLETVCDISIAHPRFLLRLFQGLEDVVSANFSDAKVNVNSKSSEIINQIMKIYTTKVFPCLAEVGGFDENLCQFAINIWDHIDRSAHQSTSVNAVKEEILSSVMMAMRVAVGYCTVGKQRNVLDKAYTVLSSRDPCLLMTFQSNNISSQVKSAVQTEDLRSKRFINICLISVFASVIMALRPQVSIPNERVVVDSLVTFILEGHIPSAQAVGSIFNKLQLKTDKELLLVECSVNELLASLANLPPSNDFACSISEKSNSSEQGLQNLCYKAEEASLVYVHAVRGLAWIAKGLLMRGHEKANDIINVLMNLLVKNEKLEGELVKTVLFDDQNLFTSISEAAADAFDVIMSDSDFCLNARCHAVIRPLYKQRFLSTVMPIFLTSIRECGSSISRNMVYRAFAHVLSNAPLGAVLNDSKKIIPVLVECLSLLSPDALSKEIIRRLLVVLSAIVTEESAAGQQTVKENANLIINCLIGLASYPHMMFVRETSIQCLTALSKLPHTRLYPMKSQVARVISKAVDDPKRAVRLQAVRCREAWESCSI